MLNIDSEAMATPITKSAPREEAQVDQRRLGTCSHGQQQGERGRRQRERAGNWERCGCRVWHFMQPEDQRNHERGQQYEADPVRAPALGTVGTHGRRACGGHTGNGD